MKSAENPNVIFNCSPSLGILDSWMPIMMALRRIQPEAKFIFLSPKARTVTELNLTSWLHDEASKMFDCIVFRDDFGHWCKVDSFSEAIVIAQKRSHWFFTRAFQKYKVYWIANLLTILQDWNGAQLMKERRFDINALERASGVLLFDLHEIEKPYAEYIESAFMKMKKYSLLHGINVRGLSDSKGELGSQVNMRSLSTTEALLFSKEEVPFYKSKYALDEASLHVVGIPRHESSWLELIRNSHKLTDFDRSSRFIFVIGRPANENYHPMDRKIQSLKDIRQMAEKYGLDVIVKIHPKEHDKTSYIDAFKDMSNGVKYGFSNSHPLVLGQHCVFAVSFFSGVAVDMVRLGTPVIERLDLRGLPFADNQESLRNSDNEAVYVYRYLGLALGASDSRAFERQVDRVITNREEVIKEQRSAYDRIYPSFDNINDRFAKKIATAIGD